MIILEHSFGAGIKRGCELMELQKIMKAFDGIINFFALCGAIILSCITLLVGSDVVMRYFFNRPIKDVTEITEHSLVYITFFVAPWVLKKEQHVRMDGVLSKFRKTNRALINSITSLVGAIICLTLFISGFQGTWDYFTRGLWFPGGMRIPQYPILSALVVSYLLLFIQFLRRGHGYFENWKKLKEIDALNNS
jgi:TRAP-type C4-dicarboxylate transport system permease small subunit